MTVQECYSKFNGNYDDVKGRLSDDKRIRKFLLMFLKDDHFNQLCDCMEAKDWQEAFMNVHTMKGVCANLSMTALLDEVKNLTELLRGGQGSSEADESFERVKVLYARTKAAIEELKDEE